MKLKAEDIALTEHYPLVTPRYTLSRMTLCGADIVPEANVAILRTMRKRQRPTRRIHALQHVCHLASMIPSPLRLSVHLDHAHQPDDELISQLAEMLLTHDLSPERLDLEFSELSLSQETDGLFYALAALRDLGVGLIFSGFGAGTSSLTLLRDRAFTGLITGLKLDRGIVLRDLCGQHPDESFVRGIINMGNALGLSTRAEGIDTPASFQFLTEIGCSEGGGEAIATPEPAPAFLHRVQQSIH